MAQNKNINTGNINTEGGEVHIGDTYLGKSLEYQELLEKIAMLKKLCELSDGEDKEHYCKELQIEKKKLEAFKRDVIRLAEIFQNIEINNERLQNAKQFFTNGLFKEAREVLETEESQNELFTLLEEKQNLKQKVTENESKLLIKANEYLVLAKLKAIEYSDISWYENSVKYFEMSISANRNYLNTLELALFYSDHKQYAKALPLYEIVVQLAYDSKETNKEKYFTNLGMAYSNLAIIKNQNYLTAEAIDLNLKAIDAYSQIEKKEAIAMCNGNLALCYLQLHDLENGEQHLIGALNIYSSLFEKEPKYAIDYAGISMNLGNLYFNLNSFKLSEKHYLKAIDIYEKVGGKKYTLADSFSNLGNLYTKNLILDKGEECYSRALSIYYELSENNNYTYQSDIAMVSNNMGILFFDKKQYDKSEESYLKSNKIRRELSKENPRVYLPDIILTNVNLSTLYIDTNQLDKAEKVISEIIAISKNENINEESQHPNLLKAYRNLYQLKLLESKIDEARDALMKAKEILGCLIEKDPIQFSPFSILIEMELKQLDK